MDASVALMNQYTMIANQFPLQPNTAPTTSVGTSTNTTTTTTTTEDTNANATVSEETVENPKSNAEETKNTDTLDSGAGPSTSKAANLIECTELDSDVTIEDIGRTDPSELDESISEVRRRRLQRFESKGVDS